ncbi:hypothetical protein [Micromonospora costi]|uniref:LPXTG cell wall anchor domain-containing protein n=1 Tax=Micromonospora costi TaxID=1530042 RepID=A0A3B0ACZ8_9ACTN|nr:hypothetical protein [Micromonospora costi]RKN58204.1 hypothetical protein D7193_06345 [Micromonospora costi]
MFTLPRAPRLARRRSWAVLALALIGVLAPDPASAHPFGAPQQIEVAGAGEHEVRVRWLVGGTDDLTLLGIDLGVLGEDRVMLDGAVTFEPSDAGAMAKASEFAAYLTERIAVAQGGRSCEGRASVADDLVKDGAEVLFTCPEPVSTVTVTSRMLTDLHEAYRTLARGPAGQKAVYDAKHESADWDLTAGPDTGSGPASPRAVAPVPPDDSARQLLVVGGIMLAAAAAGIFWYRRRRRRA